MKFDVIILAGGLGTRLQRVVSDVPKPMAPVAGKPFLDHLLEKLPLAHVSRIVFSVGHKHEVILNHFGEEYHGVPIVYAIESEPLGTGGGIKLALANTTEEHALIVNGDTFFDVDFEQFWQVHRYHNFDLTLALKPMDKPDRYGTVLLEKHRVIRFQEKTPGLTHGLINGGLYWIRTAVKQAMPSDDKFSFETDFLEPQVSLLTFGGYIDNNRFIDIGIPDDYARAQDIFSD